jgi:positive regulator of sigma E activity
MKGRRATREAGIVVSVSGGEAVVRIRHRPDPSCRGCTACKPEGGLQFVLTVDDDGLSEGDRVTVEIPVPSPWQGILLVFVVPLAALVAGLGVGASWSGLQKAVGLGAEGTGLALGAALAALSFALAALVDRRFRRRNKPRVIEVHKAE